MDNKEEYINNLLIKYRSDKCTRQEVEELFDLLGERQSLSLLLKKMEEDFEQDLSTEEDVHPVICERGKRRLMEGISTKKSSLKKRLPLYSMWAAALLLVGIVLHYSVTMSFFGKHDVSVSQGDVRETTLPDGTVVWLNSASKISYSNDFGQHTREVYLDEGEALFDVVRDTTRPFVVHASGLQARVLGTVFRVKSYQALSDVQVSVFSGKVSVNKGEEELAMLQKNQEMSYKKKEGEHNMTTHEDSLEEMVAWKSGKIVLDAVRFEAIMLAISNKYGVHINYDPHLFRDCESSIVIEKDNTLDEAMESVAMIQNIHYHIQGKEVAISGAGCSE